MNTIVMNKTGQELIGENVNEKKLLTLGAPKERLAMASRMNIGGLYEEFQTTPHGLTAEEAEERADRFGANVITQCRKDSAVKVVAKAFVNPFTAILFLLAVVSLFTDVITAAPGERNYMTVIIITTMITLSGLLRFVQERRSSDAAGKLIHMITTTTNIERSDAGAAELPVEDVVVGDIIHLSAGDMIPADMRILFAKDLFISQSALTGESIAVEKISDSCDITAATLTEAANLAFMGTNVISGTAAGMVITTGDDTVFGELTAGVNEQHVQTSFEKGVNSVSWLLIRFMLVMVPAVLFINGFTKGNWGEAVLFAISIAVGLTPEMLPMIVTTCLAKGSLQMSKEKTIIKNLNSIQNLGAMDILCTDKTGTLTQDKVVLEYHLNVMGHEDTRVLRHAFLNSYYQTGLKNLMDKAIIDRTEEEENSDAKLCGLSTRYTKVDEIPFDFERRRMSVVVSDDSSKTQMITKGAIEEMLQVSSFFEYDGKVLPLTDDTKSLLLKKVDELNSEGFRVLAVAQKTNPSPEGTFSIADENDMVLMGYLAFLDPPKESAGKAIAALNQHGVCVKVLTGDNEKVTASVCRQVGLDTSRMLLGSQVDAMTDEELFASAENTNVYAKLSPARKARIITVLRGHDHCVGYMGDGINDAPAMKSSDVGISVDTAVDIAKESADVVLLEKDLMVLEKGILEGRKTYANMIKYIKMTASSNFGNMLSVLAASAFLPFMPMLSIHLLLLNLIYDLTCTAIPWDNVDSEYLQQPRKWDASNIGKFMVWMGPTSSVFDIATYLLLYFVICPALCGGQLFTQISDPATQALYLAVFHTGWFIESMWTQTLVIHMIRTPKLPFVKSHASMPVTVLTISGIAVLTAIPFTGFGHGIGLVSMPGVYFIWLVMIVIGYMLLATVFKSIFVRKYGELL